MSSACEEVSKRMDRIPCKQQKRLLMGEGMDPGYLPHARRFGFGMDV